MKPTYAAAVLLAVVAAGCGSAGAGQAGSRPPARPTTSAPSVFAGQAALRVLPVTGIHCPVPTGVMGKATELPLSAVAKFVICPVHVPNVAASRPVTVTKQDADFAALGRDLAQPGTRPKPQQICPAYADVRQEVFAVTAAGKVFWVQLPTDACGHYPMPLLGLLNRLRS